jgi:hypothetical protein
VSITIWTLKPCESSICDKIAVERSAPPFARDIVTMQTFIWLYLDKDVVIETQRYENTFSRRVQ